MTGAKSNDQTRQRDPDQHGENDELLMQFSEGEASIPPAEEFLDQVLETKEGAALFESEDE